MDSKNLKRMEEVARTKEVAVIDRLEGKGAATTLVMARLLDEKDARIDELERRIAALEAEPRVRVATRKETELLVIQALSCHRIQTATGQELDDFGAQFGLGREPSETDRDYRERILERSNQ